MSDAVGHSVASVVGTLVKANSVSQNKMNRNFCFVFFVFDFMRFYENPIQNFGRD